jgi:hypothetical protein
MPESIFVAKHIKTVFQAPSKISEPTSVVVAQPKTGCLYGLTAL